MHHLPIKRVNHGQSRDILKAHFFITFLLECEVLIRRNTRLHIRFYEVVSRSLCLMLRPVISLLLPIAQNICILLYTENCRHTSAYNFSPRVTDHCIFIIISQRNISIRLSDCELKSTINSSNNNFLGKDQLL
jgi:hypothetical protein